jgi:hypothetical protein
MGIADLQAVVALGLRIQNGRTGSVTAGHLLVTSRSLRPHLCLAYMPKTEVVAGDENVANCDGCAASLNAMPRRSKSNPPHKFVLEALASLNPEVRRMFSGFAVYIGDRLVLMLRDHSKYPKDNGIWLVLSEGIDPADASLRRDFPSIRAIQMLGNKISHWLLIPSDGADFEREALDACDLIQDRDPRLGRIPQSRR